MPAAKSTKKRGRSAYIFFSMEVRPQVKQANPKMSFGDIAREVGRQWRALSPEEKRPYEEMAARDKETVAEYNEAHKRRRGRTAYIFFWMEERPRVIQEMPNLNFGDITREVARRWNRLPPNEKRPYEQMAIEDRKEAEARNLEVDALEEKEAEEGGAEMKSPRRRNVKSPGRSPGGRRSVKSPGRSVKSPGRRGVGSPRR